MCISCNTSIPCAYPTPTISLHPLYWVYVPPSHSHSMIPLHSSSPVSLSFCPSLSLPLQWV